MEYLGQYLLFVAKTATVVIGVVAAAAGIIRAAGKARTDGLKVRHLNKHYRQLTRTIDAAALPRTEFRRLLRRDKHPPRRGRRVFVLNFSGDIRASGVAALREEVTAVLSARRPHDEVVLRLESLGGIVASYGLAASQLERLKAHGVPLTVCVDRVAASGGYMMACVADRLYAAPFAVVGSIGVVAQLPNFHRLLKKHDIDFEQFRAGRFKRTVSLFGENTEEGRAKLHEQVEDVHRLFKDFIARYRPDLDVEAVATGEYWYGQRAVDIGLVDGLRTSDDHLLEESREADLYELRHMGRGRRWRLPF